MFSCTLNFQIQFTENRCLRDIYHTSCLRSTTVYSILERARGVAPLVGRVTIRLAVWEGHGVRGVVQPRLFVSGRGHRRIGCQLVRPRDDIDGCRLVSPE